MQEYKKEKPALPNLPNKKAAAPTAPETIKSNAGSAELRNRLGNIMAQPTPPVAAVGKLLSLFIHSHAYIFRTPGQVGFYHVLCFHSHMQVRFSNLIRN